MLIIITSDLTRVSQAKGYADLFLATVSAT
jgi:hypothetical protein